MQKALSLCPALFIIMISACSYQTKSMVTVRKEFSGIYKGREVWLLTLTNGSGNVIKLTNYGARITWIEVPDRNGKKENITFGYDTFEQTIAGNTSFGSVIGRFAGGITNGEFTMDGVIYHNPPHEFPSDWRVVVWDTDISRGGESPSVRFTYLSPDMEEGFPGTVKAEVVYTWTDNNELIMEYRCVTDRKTVVNITNHAYFNLHGAGNGNILDHILVIKASAFTPIDSDMICTGEIRQLAGTPLDFSRPHTIGERIGESYRQLVLGGGYDHNYVLDNLGEVDATVYDSLSGRLLEVITDQPGIVLYTGNYLDGTDIGYGRKPYNYRSGLCLESGHFPDSPNHPGFPSTVLNAGEIFKSRTIYRFSVKE